MSDNDHTYGAYVAFPDQSASFVLGFEAGKLWNEMKNMTETELSFMAHRENKEVLTRMAIALGYKLISVPADEYVWDNFTVTKTAREPKKANPHGLRLV